MIGVPDFIANAAEKVKDTGEAVAGTAVRGVVNGAQRFASDPIGTVASVFGGGDPSGNDGGSSNWAAWGHEDIRRMLDNTVDPADIEAGAQEWRRLQQLAMKIIKDSTAEQRQIVSNGWRGDSATAAIGSLEPVAEWADTLGTRMDDTSQLMSTSGSYAGEAKRMVPPYQPHDWGQSLGSFARGLGPGALIDAVAQDQAQANAQAEAVRIMSNVYSAPINENRAALPVFPQPPDPTLQPPDPALTGGPSPGSGGSGVPGGGGGSALGSGVPGDSGRSQPPVSSGLQNLSGGPGSSDLPDQSGGPRPLGAPGGGGSAGSAVPPAAAAIPFVPPMSNGMTGADAERARRGLPGAGGATPGGRPGGFGGRAGTGARSGIGAGGEANFGPRGSGGPAGTGPGGAGTGGGAAGRGAAGLAPAMGAGAGRGQREEDAEHQRPSYLIEVRDIFGDTRKVAPPVIGEDPPDYYR